MKKVFLLGAMVFALDISVFCGSSLPHNKEIVEADALGRRIAQKGHSRCGGSAIRS